MPYQLRRATIADADVIAAVFSPSFRLLTFLPALHTVARGPLVHRERDPQGVRGDDRRERERYCRVSGPPGRGGAPSLRAPGSSGSGAGTQLIEAAKESGAAALELWCFQANTRGRRFYEARGFRAVRFTDGTHNEERTPDVRYRWEREA